MATASPPRRRRRSSADDAFRAVHAAGFLLPFLRPEGEVVLAFADRVAEGLTQRAAIPPTIVEEGAELLSRGDRARIVRSFVRRYGRRWAAVVDAVGDAAP